VVYRITPEEVGVDLESKVEEIKKVLSGFEGVQFREYKVEPLAFGIKVLKLAVIMPDAEGIVDKIAEEIKKLEGIGEVEMEAAQYIG